MSATHAVQRKTAPAAKAAAPKGAPAFGGSPLIEPLTLKAPACACGGGCPRCKRTQPLQAKLEVSQPGDSLEQEADRVADEVMRMPQPEPAGTLQSHKGAGLRLSRYSSSAPAQRPSVVPPVVQQGLSAPGQPLDAATRTFFEPRFGRDLSHVRVREDPAAADALHAEAFAVGHDVVFAAHRYAPDTQSGRRLLAHELAHVVQQSRDGRPSLQRQCMSGPECAEPICGDPRAYGSEVEGEERRHEAEREARDTRRPGGPPPTGHGSRAASIESLASELGVDLSITRGAYVSEDIASGGESMPCRDFEGWGEAYRIITFVPDDWCIFLRAEDEAGAAALLADPAAGSVAGVPRFQRDTYFRQLLLHERAHVDYETHSHPALAAGTCSRDTEIAPGYDVDFYLSELAAIVAEFAPLLQAIRPRVADYAGILAALRASYADQIFNCHESMRGVLTVLRCHCPCADVDAYVRDTFLFAARGWSDSERAIFQDMMLSRFPAVRWPRLSSSELSGG